MRILGQMRRFLNLVLCIVLTACAAQSVSASMATPTASEQPTRQPSPSSVPTAASRSIATVTASKVTTAAPTPLDSSAWKTWPVIPTVDASLRKIYQYGQSLGNDPHAFSIFGDCQSRPDEFMGVFEIDPSVVANLSLELRQTVQYFQGSFNRESPTAQDGTTPGALLWTQWHRGKYGCSFSETPVACELRIHRPSFVIIQVGTHFESRNTEYLRKVITQLIDAGVVPILATKADNREKDERINRDMALLASEYDLPLWNFWAAVEDLPNRGLYTRSDRPLQGPIYLSDEALERHRMTGLEALNVVWREAAGK